MRRAALPALVIVSLLAGATGVFARDPRGPRGPLFFGGARPVTVGPTPRGASGTTAAACGACHTEIAREWRSSLHARAWDDPVFQAAYAVEPMQFCRNCHAPLARVGEAPDRVAAEESVSCAVCHVRAGTVLSTRAPSASPHPLFATMSLGQSAFCAPCHQFNFPVDPGPHRAVYASDEPMQDTWEEHRLSDAWTRGTTCQDCHMPWRDDGNGRRHRSHAFPGGTDVDLLRRAVRVELRARRAGDGVVVEARLLPGDTGHAYPTGDLFRRAELVVWRDGDDAHSRTLGFAREFAPVLERSARGEMVFVRRQSRDGRVPPPGTGPIPFQTLRFEGAAARVRWRLDHLLMPTPMAASHGVGEARNRIEVASGEAPVDTGGPP